MRTKTTSGAWLTNLKSVQRGLWGDFNFSAMVIALFTIPVVFILPFPEARQWS